MAPADRPLIELTSDWGFWAVLIGAVGLMVVFFQIAAPSFAPQPSVGTQIGEIAGDMARASWRSFWGLSQPQPESAEPTIWDYGFLVGPALGSVAIILSVISALKNENRNYTLYGTGLGAAAVFFQFFWMIAILIAGVVLLITIIQNLGEFFSF